MEDIIHNIVDKGARFCDIRKEKWEVSHIILKDNSIERMASGVEEGAMIRVLYGNGWGCVGTSAIERLPHAAERALSMAKQNDSSKNEKTGLGEVKAVEETVEVPMKRDFRNVDFEEKLTFMKDLYKNIQRPYVKTIDIHYRDSFVEKEIINSEGARIRMKIPRTLGYIIVTGKSKTIQQASQGFGDVAGYEAVDGAFEEGEEVTLRLKDLLEAENAPSGKMPLIMDNHLTGVFVHEAFGHAAEGDLVTSGSSCLEDRLGEMVADGSVTIVDDPTFAGYGYFPFDDEGTKTRRRVLVGDGILNDYILNRESAWKLGLEPNGGARAEDFRVKPLVRMSNTLMMPGDMNIDELLDEVDKGIYAKSTSGGQVDPAQGTFQFNAQVAYLIENGEITKPLKDVSFSGFTLETLKNIKGLTKEMKTGVGHCGKGQTAPVTDGGPETLIMDVTVGGR